MFSNENMESYRQHVLDHMKALWTNWRSDLLRYNVTKKKITLQAAYNRKPPNGLDRNEWRWLIKEIYSKPTFKVKTQACALVDNLFPKFICVFFKFQKVSARNSANRLHYRKELAHRTGSKPFRQVIWKDLVRNLMCRILLGFYLFICYTNYVTIDMFCKGGNKGIEPDLLDVFYTTRKKGT